MTTNDPNRRERLIKAELEKLRAAERAPIEQRVDQQLAEEDARARIPERVAQQMERDAAHHNQTLIDKARYDLAGLGLVVVLPQVLRLKIRGSHTATTAGLATMKALGEDPRLVDLAARIVREHSGADTGKGGIQ